jgi:hypothetical protein
VEDGHASRVDGHAPLLSRRVEVQVLLDVGPSDVLEARSIARQGWTVKSRIPKLKKRKRLILI